MTKRSLATKTRLFDAAIELLAEKGYEATSIDDIIARAGVARGTLYYHFDGKAELVDALLCNHIMKMLDDLRSIEAEHTHDPQRALTELIRAQLHHLTDNPTYTRVLMTEFWRTDRPWHATMTEMRRGVLDTICNVTKRGAAVGVFRREIDPEFAGYALFGMTSFCALDRLTYEPDQPVERLLEQLVAAVTLALGQLPETGRS
jgi:AcrR family transcriptional regulator